MDNKVIRKQEDYTYLKWSHIRSSSGTAGTFLKSEDSLGPKKRYFKLSNFDNMNGVIGHECVNEIIVDRLLNIFGIDHLEYQLINSKIEIDGKIFETYMCVSDDFKSKGESKVALDDYYRVNGKVGESHYDFCVRMGWKKYIDQMIVIDYLILNRDRHGANIEVLRDARAKKIRIAPLFDHGQSLLFSCYDEKSIHDFNVMEDKKCQNFIGSFSCFENLKLIENPKSILKKPLTKKDKEYLFYDLQGVISSSMIDKIWEMIFKRYKNYENISNQ